MEGLQMHSRVESNPSSDLELEGTSQSKKDYSSEPDVSFENFHDPASRLDELDLSFEYAISPVDDYRSISPGEDIISHADAAGDIISQMDEAQGTLPRADAGGEGLFTLNKNPDLESRIHQAVISQLSRLDGVDLSIDNAGSPVVDSQLNRRDKSSISQADTADKVVPQASSLPDTIPRTEAVEETAKADDIDTVFPLDELRETAPCHASAENSKTQLQAENITEALSGSVNTSMNASLGTKPVTGAGGFHLSSLSRVFKNFTFEEIRQLFVIPEYLRLAMTISVETKGAAYRDGFSDSSSRSAPPYPLIVMINSKSGGRLGPFLRSHLESLITREQVQDLLVVPPMDFFRYGLGCLEKLAQRGDTCAGDIRKRLRVLVAGGDGTVGWVLGVLTDLHLDHNRPAPPLGIIPLGTGNDLARSFGWGGSLPRASRSAVKRYLFKATGNEIKLLDSWQVLVKALPNLSIDFPHSLQSQLHAPIPSQGGGTGDSKSVATNLFKGVFYNYFSIGMDAQVAYGFHHLRNKAPYLARGPIANKLIYSGYSCTQGWFCTTCSRNPRARGINNVLRMEIKHGQNNDWEPIRIPSKVRAVVLLNLQSYASGRNPWGHPGLKYNEKKGFVEPKSDDTLLEVFGLYDGWHSALVMINLLTAKRLAQACALRLELRGGRRHRAYMQMDGEPWQHPLTKSGEPTWLEITHNSKPSLMLVSA
eukprot:c25996_g1_i1 orf=364-2484(-)